jgi:transcriptional regulator with XRE-family HTH domain
MKPEQLTAWRKQLGYSKTQAAEALDCHRNYIADMEAGKTRIPRHIEYACLWLATGFNR